MQVRSAGCRERARSRRLAAGLLAGCLGAFATAQADTSAMQVAPTIAATADDPTRVSDALAHRGFLYLVSRPGETGPDGAPAPVPAPAAAPARLFLYGTIHVGGTAMPPLNALTERALSGSDRLALEADPRHETEATALVKELAIYPDDDSLANHIPADLLDQLGPVSARFQLSLPHLLRLRAWMLAQSLEVLELARDGLTGIHGVEAMLARFATQRHIPVVEIEGFRFQLQLLGDAPPEVQVDELRASIAAIEDGQALRDARELVAAWSTSNTVPVEADLADLAGQSGPYARYLRDAILVGRNKTMADRAENFLGAGGTTFFAVGALHLFADDGLIAELMRRGYTVVDLQAPADNRP